MLNFIIDYLFVICVQIKNLYQRLFSLLLKIVVNLVQNLKIKIKNVLVYFFKHYSILNNHQKPQIFINCETDYRVSFHIFQISEDRIKSKNGFTLKNFDKTYGMIRFK